MKIVKRISREIYDSQQTDFMTAFATFNNIRKVAKEVGSSPEDAVNLYIAYAEQSAIQETLESLSKNIFMQTKLWRGSQRLTKARKALTEAWVIESITRRKSGKITWSYVKIKYLKRVNVSEVELDHTSSESVYGEVATNTDISKSINTDVSKDINADISKGKTIVAKATSDEPKIEVEVYDYEADFETRWKKYRVFTKAKNKAQAKAKFKTRIKNWDVFKELMLWTQWHEDYHKAKGTNSQYLKEGAPFLNQYHWTNFLPEEGEDGETVHDVVDIDYFQTKSVDELDITIIQNYLVGKYWTWKNEYWLKIRQETMQWIFEKVEELWWNTWDPDSRKDLPRNQNN